MFDCLGSENVGGCIGFEAKLENIDTNIRKIGIELMMEEHMRKFHPRVLFFTNHCSHPLPTSLPPLTPSNCLRT